MLHNNKPRLTEMMMTPLNTKCYVVHVCGKTEPTVEFYVVQSNPDSRKCVSYVLSLPDAVLVQGVQVLISALGL